MLLTRLYFPSLLREVGELHRTVSDLDLEIHKRGISILRAGEKRTDEGYAVQVAIQREFMDFWRSGHSLLVQRTVAIESRASTLMQEVMEL